MSGQTDKVRRPTSARVLAIKYDIIWLNEDEWYQKKLDNDAMGITERDSAVIWMRRDSTSNEDSLRYTLLHEILHTCTQTTRLDKYLKEVEDPEEFFIGQVSPLLLQVMHDNAALMRYLLRVN
jgi:hypothetical protein